MILGKDTLDELTQKYIDDGSLGFRELVIDTNQLTEDTDMNEEIKINDTLNKALFDRNNELREQVKYKLSNIVNEIRDIAEDNDITLNIKDVVLLGSNCSYNYTKDSDIDLHIIVDTTEEDCNKHHLAVIYNLFKSSFNNSFDITIKGIPVELYIEENETTAKSNGIYSLLTGWIKKPTKESIPDIDYDSIDKRLETYITRYNELLDELGYTSDEDFKIDDEDNALTLVDEAYEPTSIGVAYKVFRVKNGKLYPPMVANHNNESTPIGVWLDAEEGEFAGLSKTGRPQVKSTGSGTLAYRPGWHLGEIPRAKQFDRTNKATGEVEFPKDFVWAKCEYAMDVDYQPESDARGYERTKRDEEGNIITYKSDKYQHSLAGVPHLPSKGYYKYRTNPNPDTVPWIITGQMKVVELLDDYQVNEILKSNGIEPIHRQGGDKTLKELGL